MQSSQWSNKIADIAMPQTARRYSVSEYLNLLAKEFWLAGINALALRMKVNVHHVLSQRALKTI
jgi:hypothetical protein